MNSSESANDSEIILKTEEYDIPGPTSSKSASGNRLVNFNNNVTTNCTNNIYSNSLSPKLPPADRMPIPTGTEIQSTAIAGTPGQHSMSPSLPPPSQSQQPLANGISSGGDQLLSTRRMTSNLGGYGIVPLGILRPLDHYPLQLYSNANINVERLRGCRAPQQYPGPLYPSGYPGSAGGPMANAPTRCALFPNVIFQPGTTKPLLTNIGHIAMAILSSPESKLALSDIYQHLLDNYPCFRTRGPGWKNSIRHTLSLNECFVRGARSVTGRGNYWAIHPANMDDFRKGDFRRRKAIRKVRKYMGLAVDDEGTDSPSPPPFAVTPHPMPPPPHPGVLLIGSPYAYPQHLNHQYYSRTLSSVIIGSGNANNKTSAITTAAGFIPNLYSQSRKRKFDVASLLAPDDTPDHQSHHH